MIDAAKLSFIRKPSSWFFFPLGQSLSIYQRLALNSCLSPLNSRFTGAHYHTPLKICIMESSVFPEHKGHAEDLGGSLSAASASWKEQVCHSRWSSAPAGTALQVCALLFLYRRKSSPDRIKMYFRPLQRPWEVCGGSISLLVLFMYVVFIGQPVYWM